MSTSSPPLIVHVVHHLRMGGMENGLVNLVNGMPAQRYRHAVVCVEDYSDFRQRIRRDDVPVTALHRSRTGVWALRVALFKLFKQLRPEIVHSRNMSGLDALLPALLAGVPHRIHSEHGWDMGNLHGGNRKDALLRRLHSPLVDRYVAVSKDLQRYLQTHVGIDASRIDQIYNGVDVARFEPNRARGLNSVPSHLADSTRLWFGTVGRVQSVKDQATLVRAYAALLAMEPALAPHSALALFGDGPLLPDLQALALSLQVHERVWFAGAVSDVPAALRLLDVFVLPSLNEGISNTLLEAMSSALPVLATAVGGNVELVDDGVTGHLFGAADVAGLAALMRKLAHDDALRQRMGTAARQRALREFSLEAMLGEYTRLYDRLCRM